MNKTWNVPILSAGLLAAYVLIYIWQPIKGYPLTCLTDLLNVAFSLLAAAFALRAGRTFEPSEPQRRAWLTFGAGMMLWAAAEIIWMYYQVILAREVPYPSLADVAWAVGYVPLFGGAWVQYRALGLAPDARRRWMSLALYAVILIVAFGAVLWPMISNPGEEGAVEIFLNVLYPVGDLCLAFIATLSLLVLGRGLLGLPWLHIAVALLLFAASDLIYVYGTWNGVYATGSNLLSGFVDVAYFSGYIISTIGAYRQAHLSLPGFE